VDRRTLLTVGGVATVGTLAGCLDAIEDTDENESDTSDRADAGVVTVEADEDSVDAAFDRIRTAIEDNENLGLIAQLDHSENAASVDMDLPPTRVLFFGNPAAGTPLMRSSRRIGLDLPQRLLVWEDDDQVKITYNDPEFLAQRHGVEGQEELLENVAGALDALATGEM